MGDTAPPPSTGSHPAANRRKHQRFQPAELELSVVKQASGLTRLFGSAPKENIAIGIYDLSEGGMRVSIRERVAPGTPVSVKFKIRKFNDEVAVDATVAWITPHAVRHEHFIVGLLFTKPDSASQHKIASMRSYFTSPQFKNKSETSKRLRPPPLRPATLEDDLKKLEISDGQSMD
jgi:Tfp pilus assembly protein PilZ